MNSVVDEVLAGSPRYNIKDNGGTTLYSNVQIDLATQVTTAGTPLNKALFDSIQTDLNSRLLTNNKATTGEAQAGTNDTKYMTPLKVKQRQQSLVTTTSISGTTVNNQTLFDFSTATGSVIEIQGFFKNVNNSSSASYVTINGTGLNGFSNVGGSLTQYDLHGVGSSSNYRGSFYFRFDMTSKTFYGIIGQRAYRQQQLWNGLCNRLFYNFNNFYR